MKFLKLLKTAFIAAICILGFFGILSVVDEPQQAVVSSSERNNPTFTPLQRAAYDGDIGKIQSLIASGENLEATKGNQFPPLQIAIYRGHTKAVPILIAAGANVNANTLQGDATPMHSAASNGEVEVIRQLIAAGGNIDAKGTVGRTPLHWAVDNNRLNAVSALISAGANVNAIAEGFGTPLDSANFASRSG